MESTVFLMLIDCDYIQLSIYIVITYSLTTLNYLDLEATESIASEVVSLAIVTTSSTEDAEGVRQ